MQRRVRRGFRQAGIVVVGAGLMTAAPTVQLWAIGDHRQPVWWAVGGAFVLTVATLVWDRRRELTRDGGPHLLLKDRKGRPYRVNKVTLVQLGVHPCELFPDLDASPYAPRRSVDDAVRKRLVNRLARVVLLPAPRLAGASRTLANAAAEVVTDALVFKFVPDPAFTIADLVHAAAERCEPGTDALVWLEDTLNADGVRQLAAVEVEEIPMGMRIVAVVDPHLLGDDSDLPGDVQQFLATSVLPTLDALGAVGDPEREDVAATDPRYATVLDQHGTDPVLLGAALVARSSVRKALAGRSGADRDRIALLHVVLDWQRAELPTSLLLTRTRLAALTAAYLAPTLARPSALPRDRFDAAVTATSRPLERLGHPLVEAFTSGRTGHYRPHRLLTALAPELDQPPGRPIDPTLWTYLAAHLTEPQRRTTGQHLYDAGHLLPASTLLHGMTDLPAKTLVDLGKAEYQAGDHDAARRWWTAAADTHHPEMAPKALVSLGVLEKGQGEVDEARRWYQAAVETHHPEMAPTALVSLGVLEDEQGEVDEARRWYQAAVETHHPEMGPAALVSLGVLEKRQGEVDEARRWYQAAIDTHHPEMAPTAMVGLGVLEDEQGEVDEARRWYQAAIETHHPNLAPTALVGLGILEVEQGEVEEARRWYQAAVETHHPNLAPTAMVKLGFLEHEQGEVEEARRWWTAAADTHHPEMAPKAMVSLGFLEHEQGEVEEARRWYRAAIDTHHPDQAPRALVNLGVLEKERGEVEQARHWWTAAADTHHPEMAPRAMVGLGILEHEQGEAREARRWWTAAADTHHPDQAPTAMVGLGFLEKERGEVDEARRWYRAAIDTHHPDQAPKAMVGLGVLEAGLGNFDQADSWFSQAEATEHPEEASRARAEREKARQRRVMSAYLPYQSRDNESQTPFTPDLLPFVPEPQGPHDPLPMAQKDDSDPAGDAGGPGPHDGQQRPPEATA
jgi:tetratricopeptide (TPR) repeat protein